MKWVKHLQMPITMILTSFGRYIVFRGVHWISYGWSMYLWRNGEDARKKCRFWVKVCSIYNFVKSLGVLWQETRKKRMIWKGGREDEKFGMEGIFGLWFGNKAYYNNHRRTWTPSRLISRSKFVKTNFWPVGGSVGKFSAYKPCKWTFLQGMSLHMVLLVLNCVTPAVEHNSVFQVWTPFISPVWAIHYHFTSEYVVVFKSIPNK